MGEEAPLQSVIEAGRWHLCWCFCVIKSVNVNGERPEDQGVPAPMLSHSDLFGTCALTSQSFPAGLSWWDSSLSSPNQMSSYKGVPMPRFSHSNCFRALALNSYFFTRLQLMVLQQWSSQIHIFPYKGTQGQGCLGGDRGIEALGGCSTEILFCFCFFSQALRNSGKNPLVILQIPQGHLTSCIVSWL